MDRTIPARAKVGAAENQIGDGEGHAADKEQVQGRFLPAVREREASGDGHHGEENHTVGKHNRLELSVAQLHGLLQNGVSDAEHNGEKDRKEHRQGPARRVVSQQHTDDVQNMPHAEYAKARIGERRILLRENVFEVQPDIAHQAEQQAKHQEGAKGADVPT